MSKRILIVDDDPEVVKLFSFVLKRAGYAVETAPGGEAALHQIRQSPPDLIVLDVMMPGLDGYEVTRQLRAQPDTAAVPIVMLTARALPSEQVTGILAGATSYLVKPVTPSVLVKTVQEILAG